MAPEAVEASYRVNLGVRGVGSPAPEKKGGVRGMVGGGDGPAEEEIRAGRGGEADVGAPPAAGSGGRRGGGAPFFFLPTCFTVLLSEIPPRRGRKPSDCTLARKLAQPVGNRLGLAAWESPVVKN